MIKERKAKKLRSTRETEIKVKLNIDGTGTVKADSGIKFFDHMLAQIY